MIKVLKLTITYWSTIKKIGILAFVHIFGENLNLVKCVEWISEQ